MAQLRAIRLGAVKKFEMGLGARALHGGGPGVRTHEGPPRLDPELTLKRSICGYFPRFVRVLRARCARDRSLAGRVLSTDIFSLGGMTANAGAGQRTSSGA